jgi:organic hydroperoxide reductase OsmC/OhrA
MSKIVATIRWDRLNQKFVDQRYSRCHTWQFDGGLTVAASSSPDVVPIPFSDPTAVDPEEAFVASLSSCHMLWFLSLAAKQGLCVENYEDQAYGEMGTDEQGKTAILSVTLCPRVKWAATGTPDSETIAQLHHRAHQECFIANSVKTDVRIQPVFP